LPQRVSLDSGQEALLALLRTKGLSIKDLDERKKGELRELMEYLHGAKGLSLNDIAKMIGNKTSGYTSWLCRQLGVRARPFEEARLKGIREKRRKYERRPFDGADRRKAYLLGITHGDFTASKPWKGVVRVSTSTTHPAMATLFDKLFGSNGHVYRYARYKKDTGTYEWNLTTILDGSFEFLTMSKAAAWEWVSENRDRLLAYLAGLLDAEGSIGLYRSGKATALVVAYYNTNIKLMNMVYCKITLLGFHALPPYLDKKKGFRSPGFHIEMKHDYWRVLIASFDEAQSFLRAIPLLHAEKVAKAAIALTLTYRENWVNVRRRVVDLRAGIKKERDGFVKEAEFAVRLRESARSTQYQKKC